MFIGQHSVRDLIMHDSNGSDRPDLIERYPIKTRVLIWIGATLVSWLIVLFVVYVFWAAFSALRSFIAELS
jgi:hypothetical protein